MNKKYLIIGSIILIIIIVLVWAYQASTKPLPGVAELQDDRTHVSEGSKVNYKFNPPTSGAHYPSWITKGFYLEPRPDGNLVHSLEHGYIIIWYDCEQNSKLKAPASRPDEQSSKLNLIQEVFAQGIQMTRGSEGSPSAKLKDLPKSFSDGSCDLLENSLKDILSKFGSHKLIAVPRVGMDSTLVLTAWGRMEKLTRVDQEKIKEFISSYRDNGPEQTNEP